MSAATNFIITEKYLDVCALALRQEVNLIVLEGTIRSGKTQTMKPAFMYAVLDSPEELHLISANDLDSIKDNIVFGESGLLEMFSHVLTMMRDEIGGYYLKVDAAHTTDGKEKKILLAGFADASKWKKILGKTLGVILIDEVNTANEQFIDECFARQSSAYSPLQIWTLNGDEPNHWVYIKYINRCIIYSKYHNAVPASILADMRKTPKQKGWYYFHYNFLDNPIMTEDKIERTKSIYPIGSYYYIIKVLGERGAMGELLYLDYMSPEKHIKPQDVRNFHHFGIGCDIGATRAENSFALWGFKSGFTKTAFIDGTSFKQVGYERKTQELIAFVKRHQHLNITYIAIDSAEANYIKDLQNLFKTIFPHIAVIPSYKATIKERVDLGIIMFSHGQIEFNDTLAGRAFYDAFMVARKSEKKNEVREDKNEKHNDKIDACEYAWTRHMSALLKAAKDYERLVR